MASTAPANGGEMIALMRQAMRHANAAVDLDDVDEESLALLAIGKAGLLPPTQRARILRQVAASPELGALLRELRALNLEGSVEPAHSRLHLILRFSQSISAAAACLALSLLVWRAMDPPVFHKPRGLAGPAAPFLSGRDWALVIAGAVCIVFLALALIVQWRRRKQSSRS